MHITSKPQVHLILDEQSVAESRGVMFHLNQATKHPENPVMLPGEPHQWDSLCVSWPGTVLYSPHDRKFRCWYVGMDVVQTPDRAWHTGYAESADGVHWNKPELGQVDFLGRPTNQVTTAWKTAFLSSVFENPLPNALPSQRFGAYWIESRTVETPNPGDGDRTLWSKSLAWSPDGVAWTRASTAYGEKSRAPFLDISQVLYDPDDSNPGFRWKAYGQLFRARKDGSGWPGIRHIALAHGGDAGRLEDAADPLVMSPMPGVDEEIHFAAVQKIGESYLMLFESDRFSKNPIHGDLRLAHSPDGRSFRRIHPRSSLVATGSKGIWDENLLVTTTAGWQAVGDEIYIHYFGCPNVYNSWPSQYAVEAARRGSMFAPVYLGLATLPRDRFAYAAGPGTLTTHPLEIGSDGLWLNAEGDDLGVTAHDESGETVAHGKLGPKKHQTVYRKVVWPDRAPVGRLSLTISLSTRAMLFSLGC